MDGRESRLTRIILSDDKNRILLSSRMKQNKTIVGTVLRVHGKRYRITTGDTKQIAKHVEMVKESILHGHSR